MMRSALVAVFAMTLLGCQSKEDAVQLVCNAPTSCPECMATTPDQRARALATHIDEGLSNREVKTLMEELAMLPSTERLALLRTTAQDVGLDTCPLADAFEELDRPDAPEDGETLQE